MPELLQKYSIAEIIVFIVALAVAVKGLVSFYEWIRDHLNKITKEEIDKKEEKDDIQGQIDELKKTVSEITKLSDKIELLTDKVRLLLDSDRDDIKSFITREHHYFCYRVRWIDDHSLDCIERRFTHYIAEGGNSYVKDLMDEIRALPKEPVVEVEEKEGDANVRDRK